MLKTLKDNIDEFADLNKLCLLDSETSIDVSRNFVARLYDQKGKMKSAHDNLNRLRVKIAKQKDVSLAKLPPCEASFVQHVLRASLQTYIWIKSDTAQPPEKIRLRLLVGKIKTDCHPFILLVRFLQIFCVHVKANLCVLRVVFVLNKI